MKKTVRLTGRSVALGLLAVLAGAGLVQAAPNSASAKIDRLVSAKLDELGIPTSDPCTDEVFLRRVYFDLIGTLPTQSEAREFLGSHSINKRSELIEQLFDRPEFADYWSLKWCDLLRVKAEFPSKLWPNAVQAYHRWVRTALFNNMPYDDFVRALLTSSGSNFREAPVNFYRAMPNREPAEIARVVALTFMGMRTDKWGKDQLLGMAAFFGKVGYKGTAEWKEEIVFFDPSKEFLDPDTKKPVELRLPGGESVELLSNGDPRLAFTDWLVGSKVFANSMVNRIWFWLLGRGIVHEADDIRDDNPPQNPALLDFLAQELVDSGYDMRHIYRIILNSKTYQLSSIHNEGNLSDEANFSRYYVRRLDAEVLIDAICQITGTTESYSSAIPEPFTFIPEDQRSITLADGSITSPFLDLYGRPPRATGYESERNNTPSSAQKLHMLNSTHIQQKLQKNKALLGLRAGTAKSKKNKQVKSPWKSPEQVVEDMYLTILSRYPTAQEKETALVYYRETGNNYNASVDLAWALLNTKEFIYKH
ncbi:DUF1553 domain-containing protein [Pontiella sulfatireligans]|uniref:DUF1553 domain-containing protein n=1 Tax=Pontiella sulfatireligans TaxID=2750658 RepID=A0A6C2UL04_9BACT|nr:DUF1553 domain-containing protein [Pontiella sulfatireligans]VGO20925.1 hypothetical protein SCARR_02992 [Pontiella sulfatireligans]